MSSLGDNLNDTIVAAVKAQIDANVLEAFSGEETLGRLVTAAIMTPVKIKDRNSYREVEIPWIENAVTTVIRGATEAALKQAVEEERENIQELIRKALKRRAAEFAENMTDGLMESTKTTYNFKVDIIPSRRYND